jgi:hypothetical protein
MLQLSAVVLVVICLLSCASASGETYPAGYVAGNIVPLNENSAWSWFSEPRAIIHKNKLIAGSVRAVETYRSGRDDPNWGNIEVAVLDIETGKVAKTILDKHFEQDDHDDPAFLVLPDDRILAVYSRHAAERKAFMRISEPNDPLKWGEIKTVETPGKDARPFSGDNVCYSNLFRMPDGRIYDFYRGFGYDPNYMYSDDNGNTWTYGGRLLAGKDGYGPYMKYAYDGDRTIHFIATEDHPRNYDNSLYHGYLRDEQICFSDGKPLAKLSHTTDASTTSWDLTKVFPGDPDNVPWMTDIQLDKDQHPYIAFSVQKDGKAKPKGEGGFDHRFFYGRFDGSKWNIHEMAYAGTRLYRGEDDYTGLAALHPNDPDTVFISTDADPATGKPLISTTDNRRHHELFRGRTRDGGKTWNWTPITANSVNDNIRPIVPRWNDPRTALIWLRGESRNNHGEWSTTISALILDK